MCSINSQDGFIWKAIPALKSLLPLFWMGISNKGIINWEEGWSVRHLTAMSAYAGKYSFCTALMELSFELKSLANLKANATICCTAELLWRDYSHSRLWANQRMHPHSITDIRDGKDLLGHCEQLPFLICSKHNTESIFIPFLELDFMNKALWKDWSAHFSREPGLFCLRPTEVVSNSAQLIHLTPCPWNHSF